MRVLVLLQGTTSELQIKMDVESANRCINAQAGVVVEVAGISDRCSNDLTTGK